MRKYNATVPPPSASRLTFTLEEAGRLLPRVKAVTSEAVAAVEACVAQGRAVSEADPVRTQLDARIEETIRNWTGAIEALGLEAKGLWLVDFDNGEGYYCWCYPEEAITHYHGYDDGFAGRMKIV
jgi:hypothetical protein